jgi:PAS domain S-box-containing protein
MADFDLTVLFDHIPEALVILSPSDTVVFFNHKAKDFQRVSRGAFAQGSSYLDIIPEERKEIVNHVLESVKLTRSVQVVEMEYADEHGRTRVYESVYDPVVDDQKAIQFICVYFREKTVEKIFEKRSTQLLHQYSTLIENANAVIFSIDSKQYITDWNQECIRVTLFEKDEVFARRIEEFIDENQRRQFSDFVSEALAGTSPVNFELVLKRRDGQVITILLNATPRISASGDVIGVLFVGHDVTELWEYRRSLEEQIEDRTQKLRKALEKEKELVDLKNRFVSMASHEFRVPLSTITASVNHVKSNAALRETDNEKLSIIEKQVMHMRLLIDDVLTVGKVEASKLKANRQLLDLISFLKNMITEVGGSQQSHEVIFDSSHVQLYIESDEKLLRNIFINLLTNAVKFSPSSNIVDMILRVDNNEVEVRVKDHGIGIKEEDIARVFTPFNRGSNTGSIKGTGLGLSIVKRAAETLGGSIQVESTLGSGTTMIVRLPIKNPETKNKKQ